MNKLDDAQLQQLAQQHGTPLLVLDCARLLQQYNALQNALPKVDFFYAVKAFSHPSVIETLSQCGAGFDIASSGEVELLRNLHINPRRTIHTHPIKKHSEIRAALRYGCTTFVVDNIAELEKFQQYKNRVGLLLRVSFRSPDAVVDLSRKFGCTPAEANSLMQKAHSMGIHIKGLSFHVGSQSQTANAHVDAIEQCADIMQQFARHTGKPVSILDIGGGFPADYSTAADAPQADIYSFCEPIRIALAQLPEHIEVIAEPGRYLVAPAATSITSVMGKAERGEGEAQKTWYYLDDGVYGVFSGQIYDHAVYPVRSLKQSHKTYSSVLAGPTCDSIDVIAEDIQLPKLEIGDLVIGEVMGAYTAASATRFNLLPPSQVVVLHGPKEQKIYYIS